MTRAARNRSITEPSPAGPPSPIAVVPASPDRWPDVAEILGSPSGWGCWCHYYRWSSSDFSRLGRDGAPAALRSQLAHDPPPGLLVLQDGRPVGVVRHRCPLPPRAPQPLADHPARG